MRTARVLAVLAALFVVTEGLLFLASYAGGPIVFDVGPSTGGYHTGFTASEERPPTTFRWTRDHAVIWLPLEAAAGTGTLSLRFQGFLRTPVTTHVVLSGRLVASFAAPSGRFQVVRLPVSIPAGPLRLDILPEGPPDPGIAIDWIRLQGTRFRVPLAVWGPRVLVLGLFLLALAAGFSWLGAAAAALSLAVVEAIMAAFDPFALAHATTQLAIPALLLAGLALLVFRRRPHVRWVVLLVLASHLLKGAILFHPSYFYNDVRNNRRYVLALGGNEGTMLERGHQAQVQFGVAYPRVIDGKKYAFPYSPVFFLPFTLLPRDPLVIDSAIKQVVVALAAAEVLLVFSLAGLVFGARAGAAAALLAAVLPVFPSRLALALWATLGGHFADMLMLIAALLFTTRPESRVAYAFYALATPASLLTYVGGLINGSLLAGFLAALQPRRALRIVIPWAVGVTVALGFLFRGFVVTFVTEILPAVFSARGGVTASPFEGVLASLDRVRIFYGYGFPALTVAGFVLLRRRGTPVATRVMTAYALAFLSLMLMRCLPGGLFRDLKEMEFAAPLFALTAGASLEELSGRGRSGRIAAVLVALGLVAFGLAHHYYSATAWTALAEL